MLRFEKMTVKAQEALQSAQEVAARHENQQIEPIHLLAALVAQPDGVVSPLLARLGIRSEALSQEIEREIARLPRVTGFAQQHHGPSRSTMCWSARSTKRSALRTNTSPPNTCFWRLPGRTAILPGNC